MWDYPIVNISDNSRFLGCYAEAVDEEVFWEEGGPALENNPNFYPFYQYSDDSGDERIVEWNLLYWLKMLDDFDGFG